MEKAGVEPTMIYGRARSTNEVKVLETNTNVMMQSTKGNTVQQRNVEAYESWLKNDHCVRFTMLSNIHNNIIGKFEY